MLRSLGKFLVISFAASVLSTSITAQSLRRDQEIRPNGWNLPDTRRMKVRQAVNEVHDGKAVVRRDLILTKVKPVTEISKDTSCEFVSMSTFSYGEKVFAISGMCQCFGYSPMTWKVGKKVYKGYSKQYSACVTHYTFYDADGDGKFESRYNASYPIPPIESKTN